MRRIVFVLGLAFIIGACARSGISPEAGQNLSLLKGCSACHAVDLTIKLGPSWVGLYGSKVELDDGSFVTADEEYLIESVKDPNAKIVKGFTKGSMPPVALTEEEISAIVAYIKSVK